jgi:hypothetical protein
MTEQHLKFLFDPVQYVVIFVNVHYILPSKPHAAVRVCVLWLSDGQIIFPSIKLFKKSVLPFYDFFNFVSQVVLILDVV